MMVAIGLISFIGNVTSLLIISPSSILSPDAADCLAPDRGSGKGEYHEESGGHPLRLRVPNLHFQC